MHVYMLVVVILVFAILWVCCYKYISTQENFTNTETRQCVVWRHSDKEACNDGTFYKDIRTLDYITNQRYQTLTNEINTLDKTIRDNTEIINTYQNMSEGAIANKIKIEADTYIENEVRKGTNRDQLGIETAERRSADRFNLAKTYFNSIPSMIQNNIKFRNDIDNKRIELQNIERTSEYKRNKSVYDTRKNNPNFRCKSEYLGWDEMNSVSKDLENDPQKITHEVNRGDPYNWAFCYKKNKNSQEKATLEAHIKNRQYKNISIDNRLSPDPLTTGIRFMTLDDNINDKMECDDTVTTPIKPNIPNGLLELTVNNNDMLTRMRVVKYKNGDSRYIDDNASKNIIDYDIKDIINIFYELIINIDSDRIKYYIYPKTTVNYRVYYYYYDNKCNRFFGDTTKPFGVLKSGDFFKNTEPMILGPTEGFSYNLQGTSSINTNYPLREYVNPLSINSVNIDRMLLAMRNRITELTNNITKLNNNLTWHKIWRNYYKSQYETRKSQGESIPYWVPYVQQMTCDQYNREFGKPKPVIKTKPKLSSPHRRR